MKLMRQKGGEKMSKRIYGQWAGNKKGTPEDETRCIKEVYPVDSFMIPHQCRRKRGYGLKGLFCKQHAASKVDEI